MKIGFSAILSLFIFTLYLPLVFAESNPVCDGTKTNPCVVQDTEKNNSNIKHWRTSHMMAKKYRGNITGLEELWVSGSGATSEKGFKAIAQEIKKTTDNKAKKILDIDLRQESHGYLNNNAITLTDFDNWINRDKPYQQALADEQTWLQALQTLTLLANVLTPDQFKTGKYTQGMSVPIESVQEEYQLVEKFGFEYHRLTVSDHMAPAADDIDRFVVLTKELPKHTWTHIHCRGGDGRSTTFMAMFDMLKNANKVSFNDIIKRQASVDPFYDLAEVNRKDPQYTEFYKQRYNFLMHFYQYANARLQGDKSNWSAWIKEHPLH